MSWAAVVTAVAARPALWPVAVRQALRLAPDAWWRRAPHLPVPTRDYLRLRHVTQYGGHLAPGSRVPAPAAHDVVSYLRWCRDWDRGGDLRAVRRARGSRGSRGSRG